MTVPGAARDGNAAPPSDPAAGRGQRLARGLSGTNLERAGDYNQRTVLQAVRLRGETTRQVLVRETGLTAPTIANITNRLIEAGLIQLVGRVHGGRGQPALRLQIVPDGAFGIGLNIDRDHLTLVAMDLAGTVRARVVRDQAFAMPDDVLAFVRAELPGLLDRGGVAGAQVIGVGVAMPDDLGRIVLPHRPDDYGIWSAVDLAQLLAPLVPWPIHVDNDAAAAALGEAQHGGAQHLPSFFYLLITAGLGGALVVDRNYHRGANGRSGEIGLMPDLAAARPGAVVQDVVSMSALWQRLEDAGLPDLPRDGLDRDDPAVAAVIDGWIADAARALSGPLIATACLIDPDAILIGGRLPMPLIEQLAAALEQALAAAPLPAHPPILPAAMAEDASAIGAAMLPFLDRLLPSDAVLVQAGRARA